MKELSNKWFIESNNIKVFPCAYRGYYNTNTTPAESLVFDPEARSTTEANFTNTFHKLSSTKSSYVVSWDKSSQTLKCVIGGYYFEIYNHTIDQFFYTDDKGDLQSYCFCIQTTPLTLATAGEADSGRESTILASFIEDETFLDILKNGNYIFTGLALVRNANPTGVADKLIPFTVEYIYSKIGTVSADNRESATNNYILQDGQYIKVLASTALEIGTDFYGRSIDTTSSYKINPVVFPITALLDTAEGIYSLRMIEDNNNATTAKGDYAISLGKGSEADGDYAVALGKGPIAAGEGAVAMCNTTTASAKGAVALGNNTEASGEGTFAAGNNTVAAHKGAAALGTYTTTSADNQVVIGQYNTQDAAQAFIIANGTSTATSNKFTVGYDGDVKALGNLEVKGSIKATGSAANDLELGTTTANSTGSIKVYGAAASETPVFQVENTGNTTIAGDTLITNTTQSDNPASGALKVSGGVGIAKNLNVGGTAQIDSTLTVKEQGTFKAKLIVEGETSLNNNKLSVGETVNVSVDTTINSSLTVKAKASVEGGLEVAQATKLKDTLTIDGNYKTTLGGELEVSGSSDLKSTLNVAGATTLQDSLVIADGKATTLGGDVTAKGNLNVASNIAAGGNIVVSGGSNTHNLTLGHNTDTTNRSAGSVLVYTNAGNEGFKLDETGKASIFNGLVINSTQETDAATKLIVGGEATIQGALRANSLILPTTTATEGHGNLVAKNITATNEIVTNKLVVNSNRVVVDNDKIALSAPQITLTITDEDKFAKVAGRFETTGYTKLNDVIINTGDMEGIKNLTATGTIKANKFNATSDLRKKTNIEDYTCEHSILDLPIKSFEYINDDTHSKYIGCLAQDLQKICPEIVDTDKDGFLSIQETKLVYLLLDEVKKLKEQLETLKGE